MNFVGEDLDSRGQSRSRDANVPDSVEAANEIFTVYLCTSSDCSIIEKKVAEADWPNHHDATALRRRI
jgi:hypothetical protein